MTPGSFFMSIQKPLSDLRSQRSARVLLAVGTGAASKIPALVAQIAVLPIAIRVLGFDRYGVFLLVTSVVGFLGIAFLGIGPHLNRRIASAAATGKKETEAELFQTALLTAGTIGAALLIVLIPTFLLISPDMIFGSKFIDYNLEIRTSLIIAVAMIVLQIISNLFDDLRAGYQEHYITTYFVFFGGILSIILLLVASFWLAFIWAMVCAALLPQTIASLSNG
ncbi:MAG TPA: hypothetical protein VIE65_19750, partial [Methylobacter sp.]